MRGVTAMRPVLAGLALALAAGVGAAHAAEGDPSLAMTLAPVAA